MSDRTTLYTVAFLRALATGMIGVLAGVHLPRVGLTPGAIGAIVGAGLAAGAIAALIAALGADRLGRRRMLIALSLLGAAGGAIFAVGSDPILLGLAAFLGMLNGMGRDRGAALVIDQAILPATANDAGRTRAFAWYNVLQDVGHALGGLAAATPAWLARSGAASEGASFRIAIGVYAAILLATAILYAGLSPAIEPSGDRRPVRLAPESRRVLVRISSLFALDSLGGGFLTAALLSFYFYERFGVGVADIGLLFFGARIANAGSHLAAAWLAKRIGLVNTMVFTHIPSSLLLLTVAWAPSFPIAAVLFLLREGLVEMDVPTRQS
ncbi:MAG TPA: MFS transporter, partial [Verrucomicrobiae bacterium]|nr:MFS transporter [Verrucomicrobiae bacterium]